ncbi:MAG: SnoaL-like domain [Solirubrobacterales bacterium]|jgi:ketosteroid isomerase-like protein|nr:SnoaL-like domain [Solirubrobacterales bacterium]
MAAGEIATLIEKGIEAFNADDPEGVLALLTQDVEWKRVDGLPDEGGVLHGHEEVRAFLEPEVFDRARFETLEMVERGDTAIVHGVFHARGVGSGIELDVETYVVYRLRDGLACRVENWRTRADAERSSGLSLLNP